MWRNDRQRCDAIRALLACVRLERMWTTTGPTDEALDLLERRGGPLSHGEAVMLFVAFDLWNGHGGAKLDDLLTVLDGENLLAVASLLVELSNSEPDIRGWIAEREEDRGARAS